MKGIILESQMQLNQMLVLFLILAMELLRILLHLEQVI